MSSRTFFPLPNNAPMLFTVNDSNAVCATASITASIPLIDEISTKSMPYSRFASAASAIGSAINGSMPYSRSSYTMSNTLLLRVSGQFSLNVKPKIATFAFFTCFSALMRLFTQFSATYLPMSSLMRRPARMIWLW